MTDDEIKREFAKAIGKFILIKVAINVSIYVIAKWAKKHS